MRARTGTVLGCGRWIDNWMQFPTGAIWELGKERRDLFTEAVHDFVVRGSPPKTWQSGGKGVVWAERSS